MHDYCLTNHDDVITEKNSALLAHCAGNSPVTGEFSSQMPVTRNFDVFFDLRLSTWVNNREAGDFRGHRAHYDVAVMLKKISSMHDYCLTNTTDICLYWATCLRFGCKPLPEPMVIDFTRAYICHLKGSTKINTDTIPNVQYHFHIQYCYVQSKHIWDLNQLPR